MKIEKEMVSKLPREYLFVSGILDLNVKYFKKRIEEGVKASNINSKTNVNLIKDGLQEFIHKKFRQEEWRSKTMKGIKIH